MTRFMMAVLLIGSCVVPARAEYGASVGARYVDLDTRGHRGQVQEYDGKLYWVGHGDVSVSNQGSEGLFDFSATDIGSTEENVNLSVDHKSGFKASGKYQTMHHRMNYMRVGWIQNGVWVPKTAITLFEVQEDADFVMRRSESELNFAFVSPTNSARFISAQYWGVEKYGSMSASAAGTNILRTRADVDNTKRDFTLGFGLSMRESGAMSADFIRSEFKDDAEAPPTSVALRALQGNGSANSGGAIKFPTAPQTMTGAEFKFRHDVSKDLAVTGAFTGRQRTNETTQYKFNAVVGALNAAYHASDKLSLLGKLYFRAFQIDENNGYRPGARNTNAVQYYTTQGNQLDKTTVRGELVANFRPVEKVHVKMAYKLENNNRRDAPTQVYYQERREFHDQYQTLGWINDTAHSDTRHLVTLAAKAELPLGIEAEAGFTKLKANRPAFVSLPNVSDDMTAALTVPLPQNVTLSLMGGYLKEKNNATGAHNYKQSKNTYRAGLDWTGSSKGSFGADVSLEAQRNYSELFLGTPSTGTSNTVHQSATTRQRNFVYGVHGRVNLPKGFVVMGDGSYTRMTITTPVDYQVVGFRINDHTPSNVGIARGSLSMEFTPEQFKNLTARASYSVSDWVDRFDSLNSGRASVAQLGASMKF